MARPLAEPLHDAELVRDFVQLAGALADQAGGYLPGQGKHLGAHGIGSRARGSCVQDARPQHHAEGLRPAACKRCTERHVGGRLLVAGMDGPDGVAGVVNGVEEDIILHTGQAVEGIDAVLR